jgi:hypothetical protein
VEEHVTDDSYSRSVTLLCGTCGGRDFEYDEAGSGPVRCTTCDRVYSRDELMRENGGLIDEHVEEIGEELVKDLQKSLQKAFKGSKHARFK